MLGPWTPLPLLERVTHHTVFSFGSHIAAPLHARSPQSRPHYSLFASSFPHGRVSKGLSEVRPRDDHPINKALHLMMTVDCTVAGLT